MEYTEKDFVLDTVTLTIKSTTTPVEQKQVDEIIDQLAEHRGVMLTSRFEYPGRYTRFDIGLVNPPLVIEAFGNSLTVEALNERGKILIRVFEEILRTCTFVENLTLVDRILTCEVAANTETFMEEDRSKMPHIMNVVRHLRDELSIPDPHSGFYGVFGYDLGIDFMGVVRNHERKSERDLVLYFADQVYVTDHEINSSYKKEYEFQYKTESTEGIQRDGNQQKYIPSDIEPERDFQPGQYAEIVNQAKDYFARGDLFEVVPSQTFTEPCEANPAEVFHKLLAVNPAPYGALINLGKNEWTVSASPEMFVRVEQRRVESCPIAGTIARGSGEITDAQQIQALLNSKKEESELTMCTDVDRNDKSRVCDPLTIKVIGRRQIEIYSRLIHTVDHVEGYLEDGYDSIDAFLSHMWAVTVTGAPKMWAMNFIEKFEKSPRRFYGGSMGFIGLDGSINTGLMLRTIHFVNGAAQIRVGATLLADSDPVSEERETELKASAMLDVVRSFRNDQKAIDAIEERMKSTTPDNALTADSNEKVESLSQSSRVGEDAKSVLLIDCEDSFVHTLAGYFRMCNAQVHTKRIRFSDQDLIDDIVTLKPQLIVLSPGPGSPSDFGLTKVINTARSHNIPIFGVCLGLQALVEHFGGTLCQLEVPMHGKPSDIEVQDVAGTLFSGIESPFKAGRYHSLYASEDNFPDVLNITARSDDGVIMAIEHKVEPISAVQFHPESIMTFEAEAGKKIIQNVLDTL